MIWKDYSHLGNAHAFLAPSKYHWLRYSDEKLIRVYENNKNVTLGSKYHRIASDLIQLAIRLPNTAASFNSFVNDAIGFHMESEKILYYSPNCYGTVDAISYRDNILRIHDLKTGIAPGSIDQLLIYAALFCLDYKVEPVEIHLRLYQSDEIIQYMPSYKEIQEVMDQIVRFDTIINSVNRLG